MRSLSILLLFFTISANAGPGVSGGELGVCDAEKEAVFVNFVRTNSSLEKSLLQLGPTFKKSCTVGWSQLVKPDSQGSETSRFFIDFSNGTKTYEYTIHYIAKRVGFSAGYAGHAPGNQDGTSLAYAKLLSFEVNENNSNPSSGGLSLDF